MEDLEIKTQEEKVPTEGTPVSETDGVATNDVDETKNEVHTFTQEQVNEIVRKRLEKADNKFYSRYGVSKKEELDELVGKAQSYDVMKERYDGLVSSNKNLTEELTFLKNNINPERYEDVKAYFKGKDLEFNAENLIKELETHNEWLNVIKQETSPKTTIQTLGTERKVQERIESDAEKAKRIFGV